MSHYLAEDCYLLHKAKILDKHPLLCYLMRMAEKSTRKGAPAPKMKRVLVAIPEELHTAMKMAAASAKTTVKGYVTEAIRQAVEKGGERKR